MVHTKHTRFVGVDVDWRLASAVKSTLRVREFTYAVVVRMGVQAAIRDRVSFVQTPVTVSTSFLYYKTAADADAGWDLSKLVTTPAGLLR